MNTARRALFLASLLVAQPSLRAADYIPFSATGQQALGLDEEAYQGGGQGVIVRPLRFTGKRLQLNYSTSAAGSIRVEIQDVDGKAIPGFTLDDCPEIFGDRLDAAVRWKQQGNLSPLAGKTVRLRFAMRDADLYAFRLDAE